MFHGDCADILHFEKLTAEYKDGPDIPLIKINYITTSNNSSYFYLLDKVRFDNDEFQTAFFLIVRNKWGSFIDFMEFIASYDKICISEESCYFTS
jgi:hypothetical protein